MTTKKAIANRRNAQHSTGPRSVAGRARSSKNAVRHGLNVSLRVDPEFGPRLEPLTLEMAKAIGGENHSHDIERFVEAQLDLIRIRQSRHTVMRAVQSTLHSQEKDVELIKRHLSEILTIDRYEKRALSKRTKALRALDEAKTETEFKRES